MMVIFNKKIISCLFVLFVACLCIGAVSANNVHDKNVEFTVSGSDVYAQVPCDLSACSHWEVAKCDGFKLVSHQSYSSDSEMFHFQELPFDFLSLFSTNSIALKEIDSNGNIVKEMNCPLDDMSIDSHPMSI